MTPPALTLSQSHALLERASACIPGLTSSMMKRPDVYAPGAFPVYLSHGEGAEVWDVDGQRYIDFVCGLGANALGHNHPAIVAALDAQLRRGLLHSLPTASEVEVAEAIVGAIPGAEMVRTFKTGADATSAAVRLARHITGRSRILTLGYHGWHDHFMVDTPGIPSEVVGLTTRLQLFRPVDEPVALETIAREASSLAAVLLAVPYNRPLSRGFVSELREACRTHGILFVFDEIVTGFRLAPGGAQAYFEIDADLVCLSKSLAAGMPLSALTGPRDLMNRLAELQVSTTFGGETLSLAACSAALRVFRETDAIARMSELGRRLREGVNAACEQADLPLRIRGYDPIPCFQLAPDPERHGQRVPGFLAAMARRGVLLRRDVNFICAAHTEAHIDHTIGAALDSLAELGTAGQL